MKSLIIILGLIISSGIVFAQENAESRKEKRKSELEKQFQLTKSMFDNRSFVLETDFLEDRYGYRIPVSSTINFVAVDSTNAVIQIGSNYGIGPNGVGGITAKGKITNWELTENQKKRTFTLRINVRTNIGFYDLLFMIGPRGNGTASLTGLRRGKLTFNGNLIPLLESSVYEGLSL